MSDPDYLKALDQLKNYRPAENQARNVHACFCVGPQNGEPLCPCQMRGLIIRDGRYIQPEVDLGPVVKGAGLGWKLTDEAKKDIAEIEQHAQWGPRT